MEEEGIKEYGYLGASLPDILDPFSKRQRNARLKTLSEVTHPRGQPDLQFTIVQHREEQVFL